MSLIYRGKTYTQNKAVASKKHVSLIYRGKHYQN